MIVPCLVGVFQNARGERQTRLVFPDWEYADDDVIHTIHYVSVHPHLCGTCVGGDHTHVEINDRREPVQPFTAAEIDLRPTHKEAIDSLIRQKRLVDGLTQELAKYLTPFSGTVATPAT